ncbi:thiamine pyrophosphate-dependent acetolactate synthase large subunit-like protein [Lipingzhangella halophila]|uniref:Thiamine pyrophosphate-dependent acetolactate synthase large subunit-like protein n=1 Tax=Lipingzhangella halophila TaxID=1783352 RepID=A0A7W7REH8_9ACTN|nr:thiamine pyrophosphate-binding protein [Lipingzhangella halophila]MBB4930513.1 thiamine pyrophosphate-dependent acetolactate synthase large subunit-like protein [Lipingzhangella halophila]
MTERSSVAEAVGRVVAECGAARAFGVVGSGNLAVTNALRARGVPFVAARHEMGAATMADAYARMSDRLTVVSTHQGCGLTNALTGISEAAKSRTPMLVLTADTPGSAVRSNFRIDQDAAVRAVGAVSERVHSAASAVDDAVRACRTALHERRTVVLNLPLDVQAQVVEPRPVRVAAPRPVRPEPAAVTELTDLLANARRPVFVAGRGARGAAPELRSLAETAGALLATSAVANGLFRGDTWSLGISGGFSSPLAAELISDADLIVGWGCALNTWTTRHGRLIGSDAKAVQVDVEADALGAHQPVDLGVLGDVALTAADAETELAARGHKATGYRTPEVRQRIAERVRWRDEPYAELAEEGHIDPRTLSIGLDDALPAARAVSVDSGNFMGYPSVYLSVPDQYGFCFTQAFQSIGLGLATAIGTALAQPDRIPVAALGDGGFHMALAELETVVRLGLPMVIVVYNDAAYGAEVHHFGSGVDLDTVYFPDTDIASIARGFGCAGVTVRRPEDLDAVREWVAGDRAAPLVVDAKIASDGGSWWLAEAFR